MTRLRSRPTAAVVDADPVPLVRHDALITVDEQQRVVMVNAAASRMFGCSAVEMLGSALSRFIPPNDRAAHEAHVRHFIDSNEPDRHALSRKTVKGLRANGESFLAEATITRMNTSETLGAHRLVTAQLRDLSDLPNRLASFTERMRGIIALAPVAVWITEGDHIVFANKASAALFGADDPQRLLGRSIYSLLTPESHATVRQGLSRALDADAPQPLIHERIARLDGQVRDVEIAVAALPDHGTTALQVVISDVTDRSALHRELQASRHDLRRFTAGLVEAREAERRHIARELHDELGQRLTAMKMALETFDAARSTTATDERVATLVDMIDETTAAVRRIAADLRPPMLDDLGLNAAIEWLVNGWARRMGLDVHLKLEATDPPIGDSASIALYRILQETLTNVVRHSKARQVQVELHCSSDAVVLTVQDDGIGLPAHALHQQGSHGLLGMRERCQMLGGQFEIGNAPAGGVRVAVRLPLAAEPPGDDAPYSPPLERA